MPSLSGGHACNNPTCHCQTLLRARELATPHVWTIPEIQALPPFGPDHGWFYGLVECEGADGGVEIAEIIPGEGWASIDPPDVSDAWATIWADLQGYRP